MTEPEHKTPGQLIQALLEERGWTKRVLAIVLGVDETGLHRIIAGKRPVTAELAISLGAVFGMEPEPFLDLQKSYDLAQALLVARPDPGLQKRARLFGGLPIPEMIKRGWLDTADVRDVKKVEDSLVRFFGVASVDQVVEQIPHAAKKAQPGAEITPAQLAWLHRVRSIAGEMIVSHYSRSALADAVAALRSLLGAPEEARKVPRILSEAGVRFVMVEALPSSRIDGVCCWLNDRSPVIGMSVRLDRIDNFWFVLRHEIEHVLQGHGQDTPPRIDVDLDGTGAETGDSVDEEERIANRAAAEFCVSQNALDRLIARKAPFFAERDIIGFARTMGIHPGLVAGQLQHRTKRYDRFRKHQLKIRSSVAPSAAVDGWGDVYPIGI